MAKFKSKRIVIKHGDDKGYKELAEVIANLPELKKGQCFDIHISNESQRSVDINALYHVFVKEISYYTGNSRNSVICDLKLDFGYHILKEFGTQGKSQLHKEAATEAWIWDNVSDKGGLPFWSWPRKKQKRFVMRRKVTRLLNDKYMAEMLSRIQQFYAKNGLVLESINKG